MTDTVAAPGHLLVCPTPIGNLEDITLRVLTALREADVVACEDTRHTRGLLDRHGIRAASLVSFHEHNERERARELVTRMAAGETVALVSDAGMPLVSDPGHPLVAECVAAQVRVEVLPGPSAPVTALVASGLPSDRWTFVGFLPRKAGPLRELLVSETTLVAFESPRRLVASLRVVSDEDPQRPVAVCRELTKLHEEIVRGPAAEVLAEFEDREPRGEIVLVIAPAPAGAADEAAAVDAVRRLVDSGARPRVAAGVVAELTGRKANALYRAVSVAGDGASGEADPGHGPGSAGFSGASRP